jgi:uncharacterized protein YndB with AHSA1/START domain
MTTTEKTNITIEATVKALPEAVWALWTTPEHITGWNHASPDWHTPEAENDLKEGGRFRFRMESRDGTMGFDFTGSYDEVVPHRAIRYTMETRATGNGHPYFVRPPILKAVGKKDPKYYSLVWMPKGIRVAWLAGSGKTYRENLYQSST